MHTYVVRVWLPDRPGALAQVAGRVGAVRGDVVGIEILERGGGQAVDDLTITLPDDSLIDLLVSEISEVDGVAVEHVRPVLVHPQEYGIRSLELVAQLIEMAPAARLAHLCRQTAELVSADWAVIVDFEDASVVDSVGAAPPDSAWLVAFLDGARHLADSAARAKARSDLAWGYMQRTSAALAVGRPQNAFRHREREQVALVARVVDALSA